jgi:hypothetical protein
MKASWDHVLGGLLVAQEQLGGADQRERMPAIKVGDDIVEVALIFPGPVRLRRASH